MRLAPALSCVLIIAGLGACGSTIKTATAVTTAVTTATTLAAPGSTAATAGSTVAAEPQGGQGGGQGGQGQPTPEEQAARQAYRDCLTANGLVIPARGNRQGGGQGAPGNAPAGSQDPAGGAADPNTPDPNATPPSLDNNTPRPTIDPVALAKAQDACKDKLPPGGAGNIFGGGNRQGGNGQARAAALAPYYACLKDNGVKVADAPTPPTTVAGATTVPGSNPPQPGGPRGGRLAGVDQTTPEFIAANEKCKVLVPAGTNPPGQGGQGGQGGRGGADTTVATTVATTAAP